MTGSIQRRQAREDGGGVPLVATPVTPDRIQPHLSVTSRRYPVALAIIALLINTAACSGGGPPFALFLRDDMRPGTEFSALDAAALSEQKQSWACKNIWAGARSCWIRVESGMLTALIGSNDKVIRLIYVTDEPLRGPRDYGYKSGEARSILQNEVDAMRMAWDTISPHRTGPTDHGIAEYRWADSTGRWTGGLWYSPISRYIPERWHVSHDMLRDTIAFVPDSIAVTDERAYSALLDRRPPASVSATAGGAILPGRPLTLGEQFEIMRTDLSLLRDAQEEFRRDSSRYAVDRDQLMFLEREGVTIRLVEATPRGWGALATHSALPQASCVLHGGRVASRPRTLHAKLESREKEVVCDGAPYSGVATAR